LRLTELAIRRPAATWVAIMFFVVLGLAGSRLIGSELYPQTNIPYVGIVAVYPGAGAEEIASQVVEPLEEAVAPVNGLKHTFSTASEGMAWIVLEFTMDTNADLAVLDVQRAVDAALHRLPENVQKPVIGKYDLREQPIMTVVLSGRRPASDLYQLAKNTLKARLESLPGVARATVAGGREREILIEVDRQKLDAYGLAVNQVIRQLAAENVNVPAGELRQQETDLPVRLLGRFRDLREIAELPVFFPGGSVPLKEIAATRDAYADENERARFNGRSAVAVLIQKQSDAGIVATAAAVEQELAQLKESLPPDVQMIVAKNDAVFIKNALRSTQVSLLEGVLLCGLVLSLFLREWRSVLTVLVALPTSLISTFLMMYLAGFTFNLLSLMGLILCVGILVDDSIVVLENIHRHRGMGKDPVTAAIDGRSEIGLAAVAITMQDVVVFLPIAFLSGLVGQFFREFGLTVVFAALFSLLVSFTLTPMLAARWQFKAAPPKGGLPPATLRRRLRFLERAGVAIKGSYRRILEWSLRRRGIVLAGVLLLFFGSAGLIPAGLIGSEFLPAPDQGAFTVGLELPAGSSLERTDAAVRRLEERLKQIPEVKDVFVRSGRGADVLARQETNRAEIRVFLSNKKERRRSVGEVAGEVRRWKNEYPGIKMTVTEEQNTPVKDYGAPLQLTVTGPDEQALAGLAARVEEIVKSTPGTVDVRSSWQAAGRPEVQVQADRLRAAGQALSAGEIGTALRAALHGEEAGKFREKGEEYPLRVRLNRVDVSNPADLGEVRVANARGQLVPLREVARITTGSGQPVIERLDRQRLITISANLSGRPLGDVTAEIDAQLAGLEVPPGCRIAYFGVRETMKEAFRDLIMVLILSLLLVYMVLVILYESFLTPLLRLLSLPCGMIGALWALFLTGSTFNLMSLIGLVMLDGLAAKHGTLLIDYTHTLMKRGLPLRKALLEAGLTRLRPIAMTACTLIAAMLPTALAVSAGSEIRQSMAIVLIGGMATSLVLTPLLIPVTYSLLHDLRAKSKKPQPERAGASF